MTKRILLLTVAVTALVATPAHAIWMRTHSVEWWTNVSDAVVLADVSITKPAPCNGNDWKVQAVTSVATAQLKGKGQDAIVFEQSYSADDSNWGKTEVRPLQPKDRLLLFIARMAVNDSPEVIFWVNLTKPDGRRSLQAAYDNDCTWMGDGAAVLKLVKSRIAKEDPRRLERRRGIILDFADNDDGDMHWEFVRTADAAYKATLVKKLNAGDKDDKEEALYNLASYPGKDTAELIQPYLADPTTSRFRRNIGKNCVGDAVFENVTIYPLRQMAYAALRVIGESPKKPVGYIKDPFMWLLEVGFEDTSHFPYGDWRREVD